MSGSIGFLLKNVEGFKMWGVFFVFGFFLVWFGIVKVYFLGGCKIVKDGNCFVNYYMDVLERMGVRSE